LPKSSTGTGTTADFPASPEARSSAPGTPYRGRFAPSPTGPLHLGSLLAAAGSWLDARAARGEWLVRIEDLDPPREPPGAADEILRALEALSLPWDGEVLFQSRRLDLYEATLAELVARGWAYPCVCTRKGIEAANRRRGRPGERVYPGTCRTLPPAAARKTRILRARTTAERIAIPDRLQGLFAQALEEDVGDFVLRRREGYIAYQLAVVLDDCLQQGDRRSPGHRPPGLHASAGVAAAPPRLRHAQLHAPAGAHRARRRETQQADRRGAGRPAAPR
jgi:glutamyl-Q tRNA(Asp) synthetase